MRRFLSEAMSGLAAIVIITVAALPVCASPSSHSKARGSCQIFKGAWFEVCVPRTFRAVPSLKSASSDAGYDSVFFRSPDHQVEFYVYSPQWKGEPTDIALRPSTEEQVSSEVKTSDRNVVRWFTIRARNGSYTRTYQDTKTRDGSVRWVVGIKYSSQAAFEAYKADYIRFKQSLKQFADG